MDMYVNSKSLDLVEMLRTETFVDLKIFTDEEDCKFLHAHKVILGAASPVLKDLVSQSLADSNSIILPGMKIQILKSVLEFVYCGSVQVNAADVDEFLRTSAHLQLDGLQQQKVKMSAEVQLTGDALFSKLETDPFSNNIGDLIVAASQNVIQDTTEALDDLQADLKNYGVTSGDFKRFRMYPKRASDPDDKLENIYSRADSAYRRMIDRQRVVSGMPLATSLHVNKDIRRIDYIENQALLDDFNQMKTEFLIAGTLADEVFMFHGTKYANIDSILANNFSLARCAGQTYGNGIYFSEFPTVGLGYGTLILCRVLVGRVEIHRAGIGQVIPTNFDSRKVKAEGSPDHSAIHVIKNPKQILPYCVIILQDIGAAKASIHTTKMATRKKAATQARVPASTPAATPWNLSSYMPAQSTAPSATSWWSETHFTASHAASASTTSTTTSSSAAIRSKAPAVSSATIRSKAPAASSAAVRSNRAAKLRKTLAASVPVPATVTSATAQGQVKSRKKDTISNPNPFLNNPGPVLNPLPRSDGLSKPTSSAASTSQAFNPTARAIESQKKALAVAKLMTLASALASSFKKSPSTN